MRPASPTFNFAQQAGPSSPPQTPTTAYAFGKNRRHGLHFTQIPQRQNGNGHIIPNGQGPTFCYIPSPRPADLSPRSSSPDSTVASSTSGSPPRSMTSSPAEPMSSSPPPRRKIILAQGNFTVEEFRDSDYEDFDSDEESVIRPHQYEDADSDRAPSVKSVSHNDLDSRLYASLRNLHCENEDIMGPEMDREAWLKKVQAERRRKRRSSGSVQKRTLSQSIGSDTDDEDIQPVTFEGANSARRLRRKVAGDERASLIFDDPPPRIEELEEPESCEELVEVRGSDEEAGLKELPYYVQDMEVDSDEED
ncbi:hypothetical protein G7Y89_g14616 [Cudoniella acicularis]|uniref:Uncharacterized protein n=1 Tax=Cudoniella acicularis TaxID=354080 RepID=A0A8H4VUA3_9HELO|nr:hypothetical protein G7Y89_g14616 [Cudoniella acicularis]